MDLMLVVFFISFFIIASGAFMKNLQNMSLMEPLLAMIAGIAIGPIGFNIIKTDNTAQEFNALELVAQFTIAIALMATAIRISDNFFRKNKRTVLIVIIIGMIFMWLLSTMILYLIFDFSLNACLLLGAIITPTDPVVASTIVAGEKARKYLPSSIRDTLSFEAGANDGLAFPLVALGVFLVQPMEFPAKEWIMKSVIYENVFSGIIAFVIGYFAGILMHNAHKEGRMNTQALLPFSVALALLLFSGLEALKMNGIMGVFIGGIAFKIHLQRNEEIKEEKIQETMERIFTIPVFFLFGIVLPWHEWTLLGWTGFIFAVAILLLRRIPAFLALMPFLPKFKGKLYDILIMGWFGPIGVAAIFYAIHSREKTGLEDAWVIPALIVFASTIIHGLTCMPFEKLYYKKTGGGEEKEIKPAILPQKRINKQK